MQNKNKPLVTVTVSAYNHEAFVEQTIHHIINQTYGYENIELLVIDDYSTDKTGEILYELSKKYNFLFIQNKKNVGPVKNKNTLLKLSNGKYIAGCASDDYWHLEKIEKQIKAFENNSNEYAICHSSAKIIDEKNMYLFYQDKGINFQGNILPHILLENQIVAPSVLIKKEVYDKIGYYDEDLPFEDRDMWIKISQHYKFIFLNEVLVYRRQHSNNLSRNFEKYYITTSTIFKKYYYLYQQYGLIKKYHYMMFDHMSAYSTKTSLKHFKKSGTLILRFRTLYIFLKLLLPQNINLLQLKRIFNKW